MEEPILKSEEKNELPPAGEELKAAAPEQADKKEKKGKKSSKLRGRKGKTVKQVSRGFVYIQATYNNTLVTITDQNGNVLAWSSAGLKGFKGPKKATPYAAAVIIKDLVGKVQSYGFREANVFVKGVGGGRDAAVRALHANGIEVTAIKDITPIPHNGCRPPKVRRV